MNKKIGIIILLTSLLSVNTLFANDLWTRIDRSRLTTMPLINADKYVVYVLDETALKSTLFALPADRSKTFVLDFPMPDGSFRSFRVWQAPVMPDMLAGKYPQIRTFTGEAVDNRFVTIKLDFTLFGFHSMIFDGSDESFVDPYDNTGSGYYIVHKKADEHRHYQDAHCATVASAPVIGVPSVDLSSAGTGAKTVNGYQLRTYKLALACSHQYAAAATSIGMPTVAQVFSKMVTSMNRINGVYERELSITMIFADKEDTLIWNQDTGGPNGADAFSSINDNPGACIATNQTVCDTRIGAANYDIGHVFTTGAGGLSQIGIVCKNLMKAQSVTGQSSPIGDGFDIDFVAHEMGHEFGADHSFNSSSNNCGGGNLVPECAYEPGSGSTLMAYAGICSPDDIQMHSDDYFHAISLLQIQKYITGAGDGCPVKSISGNKPVYLPPFTTLYNIPELTPFELTAPAAVDSVADTLTTYCWEEWDLGAPGTKLVNTHASGPIFRSYRPVISPTRIFPRIGMVLAGTLSDAGNEGNEGEKVPDTVRMLTFRLTMRAIFQGNGCFMIPDDSIVLNAATSRGFKVTSQTDSTAMYIGNTSQVITWDVAGTNGLPVNSSNVDIYMSEDGGYNWPHHIGTFPNTGSVTVPIPNPDTTTHLARIKVKGSGNVFFNVNGCNFTVEHTDGGDTLVSVYPSPTRTFVRVSSGNKGEQHFVIYDAFGRKMISDVVNGFYDIPVQSWARGMYFVRIIGDDKRKTIKKFVVQ